MKYDRIMISYVLHNKDPIIQNHYFVRQNNTQKMFVYDGMMIDYVLHNEDSIIQNLNFVRRNVVWKLIT